VGLPIAIALGLGIVGLLLFLLASLGWLNTAGVLVLAVAILVSALVLDRQGLIADFAHLRGWRLVTPSWFETIVIGWATGALTFAMLWAFVPENMGDATRDHLPAVREIWQSGAIGEQSLFGVSSSEPVQAHLLYAVAYGLGGDVFAGISATKLVHIGVGLVAIAGVAGLGWLFSGRLAAVVGAAIFATTPLVLYEFGHTLFDLFPVLYTVTALLCLILWQRVGAPAWLVVAGSMAGFGFAAKPTMGWVGVALAAAIFLAGRKPWQVRERILAVLAFGLGTVVIAPWLIRSYSMTGTLPELITMAQLFSRSLSLLGAHFIPWIGTLPGVSSPVVHDPVTTAMSPPGKAGPGHSLINFGQMPWLLTFRSNQLPYGPFQGSSIGIAWLVLLPLAMLGPRTRTAAILAVAALVSYVGWWFTPLQVTRHLLPTLAIAAPLAGAGVAGVVGGVAAGLRRPLMAAVRAGVLVGLATGLLLLIPEKRVVSPIDRITGRETAAEYVAREIPSAAILAAANDELPPDTLVGYVGAGEGAGIYTEVLLRPLNPESVSPLSSETTPAEVLARLDLLGIDYIIWDRAKSKAEQWHSTLLSTEFLRDHTRILAGEDDNYLFEVLPGDGSTWGMKHPRNLLTDRGLDTVKRDPSPWTIVGKVKANDGLVSMGAESSIAQRVPVSAGSPYLLSVSARCTDPTDRAELTVRWFDGDGINIGTATEQVNPGTHWSEQFLWRRAPDQAASVSAELTSSQCAFDAAALYALS
jgi:4-amino-4-deoxy-L-arabinose transferase-like glycosyltransferase